MLVRIKNVNHNAAILRPAPNIRSDGNKTKHNKMLGSINNVLFEYITENTD